LPSAARRLRERREREREAQRAAERAEQRREEALERAREIEREAAREEERRLEALAQAKEFEQAEERARARAAALRARLADARRMARRAERHAERGDGEREQAQAAERAAARVAARHELERDVARAAVKAVQQRDSQRAADRAKARQDEQRAAAREARRPEATARTDAGTHREEREEARRAARTEERREAGRETARAEEARATGRELAERERRQSESRNRDRVRDREEERATAREVERRAELRAERRAKVVAADRAEARRSQARQAQHREVRRSQAITAAPTAASELGPKTGQRIPAGRVSGSLPWLGAPERSIVDETGAPVTLRGVTVRGFEQAQSEDGTFDPAVDDASLDLIAEWGGTCVTVAIAQDLALDGSVDAEAEDYLSALDAAIDAASARGLYTVVQLGLLSSALPTAPGRHGNRFDPPVPDTRSVDLWATLAMRYQDEPAVLFDLFRSPHDPAIGDSTGDLLARVTGGVWRNWLLAMLGEIRRSHPRALVIARGLDHGHDVSAFPLANDDGSRPANVVYFGGLDSRRPGAVLNDLERLGGSVPVGVTWRAGLQDGLVVEGLGRRLARAGIGWIADGWSDPDMRLVDAPADRLVPTRLGLAFRSAIAQPPSPDAYLRREAARTSLQLMPQS
jgi:hypothetical protein